MRFLAIALILLAQIATYPPDYGDMSRNKKGKGKPPGVTPGPPPANCKPCGVDYDFIKAVEATCFSPTAINPTCSTGDPTYLILACDPYPAPPSIILIFMVNDSYSNPEPHYCSVSSTIGSTTKGGLNQNQVDRCREVVLESEWCS